MRLLLFFILFSVFASAQHQPVDSLRVDTSDISVLQVYESFNVPANFQGEYRIALRRVKKVYPLALYAAEVIDSLDREMEKLNKRRKQNRVVRQTKKSLMDEFKFVIRDLYVSEGQLLTKLIYRETGMTVREIIKKYKNGFEATFYSSMGKIFDQNLDEVYDPENRDYVIEIIVQEIINEQIEFDPTITTIDKEEFKEIKKEDRQRRRDIRKEKRKKRKQSS